MANKHKVELGISYEDWHSRGPGDKRKMSTWMGLFRIDTVLTWSLPEGYQIGWCKFDPSRRVRPSDNKEPLRIFLPHEGLIIIYWERRVD